MTPTNHTIIFSHGFGTQKDSNGMFTAIANALPEAKSVLFDYTDVDLEHNTLTAKPFSEQVALLKSAVETEQKNNPDAIIDIICHSQGSLIPTLANLSGIRKMILLAPPATAGTNNMIARYQANPKTEFHFDGMSKLPRTDGSTTLVPAVYWEERKNETSPIGAYNKLAETTELFIIKANQDNVIGNNILPGLSENITVKELDGDHGFTETRPALIEVIRGIVL